MDTKHLDKWLGQLDVYGFLCAGGCSRTIGPKSIRSPFKKHHPQWMCFETHLCGTTVKHGKHCEITSFSSPTLHSSPGRRSRLESEDFGCSVLGRWAFHSFKEGESTRIPAGFQLHFNLLHSGAFGYRKFWHIFDLKQLAFGWCFFRRPANETELIAGSMCNHWVPEMMTKWLLDQRFVQGKFDGSSCTYKNMFMNVYDI